MNWRNILALMHVERKSGRLLRGVKLTRYRESGFFAYWPYWVGLAFGVGAGLLAGLIYSKTILTEADVMLLFREGTVSIFLTLPTLVLVYNLVFTMLQQIQRSGIKASSQVPYWLPVTWEEYTLASILANLLGFPLASIIFIVSTIMTFSAFSSQLLFASITSFAVLGAAFMASALTEILRILQVRFIGAVYKTSGRAAVWVRFFGSLFFFLAFYIIYLYVTSGGAITFIQTIKSTQTTAWFIPFVWLGMMLYSFTSGLLIQGSVFLVLSILFLAGLFFLAALLNKQFGLYEPPAIKISRGAYVPRTGFLGKLGFTATEAALIRKDLRAFTRRRELMSVFIIPIVLILVQVMQSTGSTMATPSAQVFVYLAASTFLLPSTVTAISLGNFMIGEEGQAIWRIYASPISAKTLVKSKYFFIIFFSVIVLAITGALAFIVYNPSLRATIVAYIEALFLICALGAISLSNGIKGADFTEIPRPRMIRLSWSLINLGICLMASVAILAPFFPFALSAMLPETVPNLTLEAFLNPLLALAISAIIAVILTGIFYQIAIRNARDLLTKTEI
ncbi:MAG: hypothetical protein N3E52_04655 [Candidatus Bathyarchaeota archaeon]|nr:hypothetical protein [Candidatus Bathyarchaeota archaeon]